MSDLVPVNALQNLGSSTISRGRKLPGEISAEIEIRLLESQTETRHIIDRVLHWRDGAPEISAYRNVAEVYSALFHSLQIHARMCLLIFQCLQHSATKSGRRVWKPQEN